MDHYKRPAPPKPHETFGTTKKKYVKEDDGRKTRESKNLVQFNVKVRSRVREQIEDAFEQARAEHARTKGADDRELSKGDFMERMLAAYLSGSSAPAVPGPSAADRAAGRTEALTIYSTPDLAKALTKRSEALGWTIGATVENVCAIAKEAEGKRWRLR